MTTGLDQALRDAHAEIIRLQNVNKRLEAERREKIMFNQMNLVDMRNTKMTTTDGTAIKVNNKPTGWYATTWRDDKPTWDGEMIIEGLSIYDMCSWLNVNCTQ